MNNIVFIILYFVPMSLTYLLRLSGAYAGIERPEDADGLNMTAHIMLGACYGLMVGLTYWRGKKIGNKQIAAFPFIGAMFDMLLPFIPFIPSIMNVITLMSGSPKTPKKSLEQG